MQIYRIPTAGRIDALQLADAQAPTPGPNQVVVRVMPPASTTAICRSSSAATAAVACRRT